MYNNEREQYAMKPRSVSSSIPNRQALWRTVLLRLLAVLFGLLIAVLGAEIGLRVCGYRPQLGTSKLLLRNQLRLSQVFHCYPSNPHNEFQPVPDISKGLWRLENSMLPPRKMPPGELGQTPWCVEYNLSEQGLRGRQYDFTPPVGTSRIVCVGDSFVFGDGVPLEGTLPVQIESQLGTGFEVVNLGVSGLNARQELDRLMAAQSKMNFSRVLFVFIANDIEHGPKLAARQTYVNDLINIRDENLRQIQTDAWYHGRSRLLDTVSSHFAMRRITTETIQWYLDLYDPAYNRQGLNLLAQNFHQLAQLESCQVVLVLYPLLEGLEGDYPLAPVHERVSQLARQAGLPVCDLAPAFAGRNTEQLQVHAVDHHPNSKAHALAAEAIVKWLKSEVPDFLPSIDATQRGLKGVTTIEPK